MRTRTNRIRLNESQLQRIIKESVKKVLNEHLNDLSPIVGHKISPKQALAQYLRISPKNIKGHEYGEVFYCLPSMVTNYEESSWGVFNSYASAENSARKIVHNYCSRANPNDDFWIRVGYDEKIYNVDFDCDTIADDIIDSKGIECILSSYDGTSTELPDGYVGFRQD